MIMRGGDPVNGVDPSGWASRPAYCNLTTYTRQAVPVPSGQGANEAFISHSIVSYDWQCYDYGSGPSGESSVAPTGGGVIKPTLSLLKTKAKPKIKTKRARKFPDCHIKFCTTVHDTFSGSVKGGITGAIGGCVAGLPAGGVGCGPGALFVGLVGSVGGGLGGLTVSLLDQCGAGEFFKELDD